MKALVCLFALFGLLAGSALTYAFPVAVEDSALQQCIEKAAVSNGWKTALEVEALKCHKKNIRSLQGIETLTRLKKLSLYNNKIKSVNSASLKALTELEELNLARNPLETLDVEGLPALTMLYVFSSGIRKLSLQNLPSLNFLKANGNAMTAFEYKALSSLEKIYIFNNELEYVDIHNLPSMNYMDCRQNPMPDKLYDEMDAIKTATILHDGNAEDW